MAAECGVRQTLNVGAGQALDVLPRLTLIFYGTCAPYPPGYRLSAIGAVAVPLPAQRLPPSGFTKIRRDRPGALNRNDVA
ncbi:hypothetical protein SAMN04489743_0473 [Pseudarthrobacter equi]|uniref:Uncharacterized protein n=1 Tax=Pseudarthrobacter equi TaxID=728066 RepID=A0A1H1TQA6_9MICC|nr:hypothetical protein SAMN04489743_0473 [Pseudarthrobacter equi]